MKISYATLVSLSWLWHFGTKGCIKFIDAGIQWGAHLLVLWNLIKWNGTGWYTFQLLRRGRFWIIKEVMSSLSMLLNLESTIWATFSSHASLICGTIWFGNFIISTTGWCWTEYVIEIVTEILTPCLKNDSWGLIP